MDCKTARTLFDYARPRCCELDPVEARALEEHLSRCPECDTLAHAERLIDDHLGKAVRQVDVPPGLRGRLLARLQTEVVGRQVAFDAVGVSASRGWIVAGETVEVHLHWEEDQTDLTTFKLTADAASKGVKTVAWFDSKTPLRSGWAWGQQYLENGAAAIEAPLGCGKVLLFGPEILQRAQPHGTFKFLFNGIYESVGPKSASCAGR